MKKNINEIIAHKQELLQARLEEAPKLSCAEGMPCGCVIEEYLEIGRRASNLVVLVEELCTKDEFEAVQKWASKLLDELRGTIDEAEKTAKEKILETMPPEVREFMGKLSEILGGKATVIPVVVPRTPLEA